MALFEGDRLTREEDLGRVPAANIRSIDAWINRPWFGELEVVPALFDVHTKSVYSSSRKH